MKKILAFILAIVMTFSMVVLPAGASLEGSIEDAENLYGNASSDISGVIDSAEDIYKDFESEDYESAVKNVFVFMEKLFEAIHGIVHGFSEIFDFDCPFCDGDYVRPEKPDAEEPTTEEPTTEHPIAEYSVIVKNSTLASDINYNYTSKQLYAMYAKVGIKFWNRGYVANKVTINQMATAFVETAILIDVESVGVREIVFEGSNNFHGNGGNFKLIVNNSTVPVKVKLNSTTYVGRTQLTNANVGDYIVGPYTLA